MKFVQACVLVLGLLLAGAGWAHQPMEHRCVAPERPADEQDDELWQTFLEEINQFRECVNSKMMWHQTAASAHNNHAREVVESWNAFVRTSLNAPEDFPWPPED